MDDLRNARGSPPFSLPAQRLFFELARRGGVLRLRPLLRDGSFPRDELVVAISELADRCRIAIRLRPPRDRMSVALADIDRITLTAFGRRQSVHA